MKKFSIMLAALAVVASSCKDETTDVINGGSVVDLTPFTTRADLVDLADLMDDEAGFKVYATSGKTPTTWMEGVDGTNNYGYSGSVWGWTGNDVLWPTEATDYPINFYALYSPDYTNVTVNANAPSTVNMSYAPSTDITKQVDILATRAEAASRPKGDKVSLCFGHILSRVSFTTTAGFETDVHVQSVGLNQAQESKDFDFIDGTWTDPATLGHVDFEFLPTTIDAVHITGADAAEKTDAPLKSEDDYLMLVPQTATSWDPTQGASTVSGAHIEVIYRLATAQDADMIGYTDAANHPDFDPERDAKYNEKPLFVKVGYPFANDQLVLEEGMAYNFDLHIGTNGASNGYVIDKHYYDEEGNPTDFLIENKDINDPISDGTIDFVVDVCDWDESDVAVL